MLEDTVLNMDESEYSSLPKRSQALTRSAHPKLKLPDLDYSEIFSLRNFRLLLSTGTVAVF